MCDDLEGFNMGEMEFESDVGDIIYGETEALDEYYEEANM